MLSGDAEAAPKAAFNLGAALAMQGRLDEAVEPLRLAIDSGHPDEAPGASVRLGIVRAQQGDLGAARAAYAFAAASGQPEFAPQALALLAELDGQQPSTPSPGCHRLPNRRARPRQLAASGQAASEEVG